MYFSPIHKARSTKKCFLSLVLKSLTCVQHLWDELEGQTWSALELTDALGSGTSCSLVTTKKMSVQVSTFCPYSVICFAALDLQCGDILLVLLFKEIL